MGYDFETDKKYNFEKNISMTLKLEKTCYSIGEIIEGEIILSPKSGKTINPQLINPCAMIMLDEKHHYTYLHSRYVNNKAEYENRTAEENKTIYSSLIDLSNFNGANMLIGVNIRFQIKVPEIAYPSCFFDSDTYVKHFLTCDFPTIEAKKTAPIIIKNSNIFFSVYNGLLKTPAIYYKEATKYKYAFFKYGSLNYTITLPKNIYAYDENINVIIDIDCSKLEIDVNNIGIYIYRKHKKNEQKDHKKIKSQREVEIIRKNIPIIEEEKIFHIEEVIKLPNSPVELNPKEVYKILDKDNRKYSEKFNVKLFPSCYGGLLSCEYYMKVIIEMNSWFSSNEQIIIPLDFYEPFNNTFEQKPNQKPYINNNNLNYIPQYNSCIDNKTNFQQMNNNENISKSYIQPKPQTISINNQNNDFKEEEYPSQEEINKKNEENKKDVNDNGDEDGSAPPPSFNI